MGLSQIIFIPLKTIPLTQGKVAIVDDEDYPRLSQFKWYYIQDGQTGYAVRGRRPRIWMHRVILGITDGDTDHQNGNGLDNRKENLRPCNRSQNCANRRKLHGAASKFKGVYRSGSNWIARLQKRGTGRKSLGTFKTEQEASRAYNQAAKETYGEFALLNEVKN
jgi:hypothetical protein